MVLDGHGPSRNDMSLDLPAESVSGRDGWDWNRMIADEGAARESETTTSSDRRRRAPPTSTERIETLERELRRKEHRTQAIIDRYELLLTEKNRKLAAERADSGRRSLVTKAISRLRNGWLIR